LQSGSAPRWQLAPLAVDALERLLVVALYGGLAVQLLANLSTANRLASLLLLPSEGLVVFFVLIRRRTSNFSTLPGEWVLALMATSAPLLARPGDGTSWLTPVFGGFLMLFGMLIQVHAKIALGRSFGLIPAHRGLKKGGPYHFVRHPMYLGYLVGHVAFLLMNPTLWNAACYALACSLQVPRLLAEERLLSQDPQYRSYQQKVRYRLLPGLF
jgi:protein-S-isoprenylcysteine O-methyltransferase Ste14